MNSLKNRNEERRKVGVMLKHDTEDESYRRYKNRCYRNLIIESLLAFLLGFLVSFTLGCLVSFFLDCF